jgi:hypothetical protein
MRLLPLAVLLCTLAVNALAADFGAPLGAPSVPSLMAPGGPNFGATAPTRLRSLGPGPLEPAGPLGTQRAQPFAAPAQRPIERRLDCFEAPVAPDRDGRTASSAAVPPIRALTNSNE